MRCVNAFTTRSPRYSLLFRNRFGPFYDQGCLISMEQRPRREPAEEVIPAFFSRPLWGLRFRLVVLDQ